MKNVCVCKWLAATTLIRIFDHVLRFDRVLIQPLKNKQWTRDTSASCTLSYRFELNINLGNDEYLGATVRFSSHSAVFVPWNRAVCASQHHPHTFSAHWSGLNRDKPPWHPPWVYAQLWGSGPHGAGSVSGRCGASRWSPQWCRPAGFPDRQPPPPLSVFMAEGQENHKRQFIKYTTWIQSNVLPQFVEYLGAWIWQDVYRGLTTIIIYWLRIYCNL